MTKKLLFFVLIAVVSLLGPSQTHLCSLVDDHITTPDFKSGGRYNNGYQEERYHVVLDSFIDEFKTDISQRGGTFHIMRDWSDGAVNAWAWRIGQEYWMEVPGGMARYGIINEEAFLSTLCHELGHLLGGAPQRHDISYEGQADYYAPMKCMERILTKLQAREKSVALNLNCHGKFCGNRFLGIQSLTRYYAEIAKDPVPSLKTPSSTVVSRTERSHPKAQCRFDTMIAALRCNDRKSFDSKDPNIGACSVPDSARPLCWFNPKEFL